MSRCRGGIRGERAGLLLEGSDDGAKSCHFVEPGVVEDCRRGRDVACDTPQYREYAKRVQGSESQSQKKKNTATE
jgi:hypothetical protein